MSSAEFQPDLECCYRNASDRMVILRCCGPKRFFLERVVFPFELFSFICPKCSEIKVWTHSFGGLQLIEAYSAEYLAVERSEMSIGSESMSPWLNAG